MRLRGLGAAIAVFAAATMIASANGGIDRPARIDLSSRAAINAYLKSIGVNPAGVVVQRGQRNYAGPNCPGKGWTCTRSTRVVQIATAPARGLQGRATRAVNAADCTPSSAADPPDCVLIQGGPGSNSANIKQTGKDLSATLTQTGTTNTANIIQQWSQKDSTPTSAGTATQKITLTQSASAGGSNSATINQQIIQQANVRTTSSIDQRYQGDQLLDVNQTGELTATNSVNTSQTMTQDIVGRTTGAGMNVTQNENASDLVPDRRNISARIDQTSGSGTNTVVRKQKLTMNTLATATNGNITQTQGSTDGGIDASSADEIHQESSGVSTSTNTLDEAIKTSASTTGTVLQTQHGPLNCCSGQTGNANNVFNVAETVTLTASDPNATQTNMIQGDASSSGNTSVNQTQTIDGQTQTQSCTSSSCNNTLTDSSASGDVNFNNTDVRYFGFGGMRTNPGGGGGVGTITVAGVTGTVTKALLYWNGPTGSSDPTANANVTFNGTPVTGVNIGFAFDCNWPGFGFTNSQSYRADVTSLVSGDGPYSLANFTKAGPPIADVNGASLVVFFNDGNTTNDRNVALFNGDDSNVASTFDPANWNVQIPGVNYQGGTASLDTIVSDGQAFFDDALVLNGTNTLAPAGPIFQGDSVPAGTGGSGNGSLWDVKSFDITSFLSVGTNDLTLTTGANQDCITAVVVAANVPSAAPIP